MPDFAVHIRDTDERFTCKGGRSVLEGMEALGRKGIPIGCRSGGCGVCKVRILSGAIRRRAMSRAHVSLDEEADGFALACRSYPEADLELAVIGTMARVFQRT